MKDLNNVAHLATSVSALVHELQKERGASAGYISSKDGNFNNLLNNQKKKTNEKLKSLLESFGNLDTAVFGAGLSKKINATTVTLGQLEKIRNQVIEHHLSVNQMTNFYTFAVAELLSIVEEMASVSQDKQMSSMVRAYIYFLQGKENAGLERAIGSIGFEAAKFTPPLIKRFLELIAKQETFFKIFLNIATSEHQALYAKTISDPIIVEVEQLRNIAQQSLYTNSTQGVQGLYWFEAMTKKINLLMQIENRIAAELKQLANLKLAEAEKSEFYYTLFAIVIFVMTGGVAFGLSRGIAIPLDEASKILKELATGNLDVEIAPRKENTEIGNVFSGLEKFKQSAISLQISEDSQSSILQGALDAIITVNMKGEVLEFNPSAERMFGFAKTELMGKNIADFIIPEELKEKHKVGFSRFIQKGTLTTSGKRLELPALRSDGSKIDIELSITHVINHGQVTAFIQDVTKRKEIQKALESSRDELEFRVLERTQQLEQQITERKEIEAQLRKSEETLTVIAESASDWFWTTNEEMRMSYLSARFFEITGFKPTEIIGSTRTNIIGPEALDRDPEKWRQHIDDLENHRSFVDFEYSLLTPKGEEKFIQISGKPAFDENGKFVGYCGAGRDVTARKKAEIQSAHRAELVRLLHLTATIANEAEDFNAAIQECIDEVCDCIGWPIGHAYFRSQENQNLLMTSKIWHLDDPGRFKTFVEVTEETNFEKGIGLPGRVLESGKPAWIIDINKDSNFPRLKIVSDFGIKSGFALPVMTGSKVAAVLEFFSEDSHEPDKEFMDILVHIGTQIGRVAERRHSENELKDAMNRANAANLAKSEFLSSMSHELRTPMNAILGFGQMLDFNPLEPLSESQKECVSHILKGGQHLLDLINEILDLAKIEAGKVKLSIEDITPANIFDECQSLIMVMAEDHGITISISEAANSAPKVCADHTRFKQLMLNLMSNAVKYNQENGAISIDALQTADNMLRITVSDTGVGIPAHKQAELFKPFSRLGAETTDIEGTGIGLVVTKELVELMNGTVGVESEVGKGTTFWIELPMTPLDVADAKASVEEALAQTTKRLPDVKGTLLYVEDNPDNLRLMELIVKRIDGLTMISAHTGELGIELARAEQPDLIILDINLPGINGIETLKKLENLEDTKKIPVIALSAAATKRDIEKGKKAGFLNYLTKPIEVTDVVDAISEALQS